MKIKECLKPRTYSNAASFMFLLLRLVMGAAFVMHGLMKIQSPGGPMGWMPEGAPIPGFLQLLAAISEFGGGISLILGLLVPLSSLGLICTMLVATSMHAIMNGDPFVGHGGGSYELPLLYLILSVFWLICGPGKFSVDAKIFGAK